MSGGNLQLGRLWFDLFNVRDIEGLVALCDPNIEFHSVFAAVGGATYRGQDEMRGWHRDLQEAWGEEIRLEPEAFFELGEELLTFYMYKARGHQSGVDVAMPAAAVLRSRDGRITYIKAYRDRAEALRELGVTEEELEPIAP